MIVTGIFLMYISGSDTSDLLTTWMGDALGCKCKKILLCKSRSEANSVESTRSYRSIIGGGCSSRLLISSAFRRVQHVWKGASRRRNPILPPLWRPRKQPRPKPASHNSSTSGDHPPPHRRPHSLRFASRSRRGSPTSAIGHRQRTSATPRRRPQPLSRPAGAGGRSSSASITPVNRASPARPASRRFAPLPRRPRAPVASARPRTGGGARRASCRRRAAVAPRRRPRDGIGGP